MRSLAFSVLFSVILAGHAPTLEQVLQKNNRFRAKVAGGTCATKEQGACWINHTILAGSVFNYGIPRRAQLTEFNALNDQPTLHDLLSWLGAHTVARSGHGLSYLEMGVSSLKNFDTQVNHFRDNHSVLAAMDIEDPNPKRASTWGEPVVVRAIPSRRFNSTETRATLGKMLRDAHHLHHPCVHGSNLCEDRTLLWPGAPRGYHARSNTVVYTTMDQMDSVAWAAFAETHLRGLGLPPLDLVFSDGLHTYPAVLKEFHKLSRLGLLLAPAHGRDFTMVWDDCFVTPPQKRARSKNLRVGDAVVERIAPALAEHLRHGLAGQGNATFCFIHFKMATWIGGERGGLNEVCLFTTLDISSLIDAPPPSDAYGGLGGENCTRL